MPALRFETKNQKNGKSKPLLRTNLNQGYMQNQPKKYINIKLCKLAVKSEKVHLEDSRKRSKENDQNIATNTTCQNLATMHTAT